MSQGAPTDKPRKRFNHRQQFLEMINFKILSSSF